MTSNNKKAVAIIHSLPLSITNDDLRNSFEVFGEIEDIQIMNFFHKKISYVFNIAFVSFKGDLQQQSLIKKRKMNIKNVNVEVDFEIQNDYEYVNSVALLYDVKDKNKTFSDIEEKTRIIKYKIPNKMDNESSTYIIRFDNSQLMNDTIKQFKELDIQPILSIKKQNRKIIRPKSILVNNALTKSQYDFYLIHLGRKYYLIRDVAKHISQKIKECKSNFIELPDVPGPIQIIVDLLLLRTVEITPDFNDFISYFFSFLEIKPFPNCQKSTQDININNVIHFAKNKTNYYNFDYIVKFISSNLTDLVNNGLISQLPSEFIQPVFEHASMNNANHDSMLQALSMIDMDDDLFQKCINCIHTDKLTKEIIQKTLSSDNLNLNKYRDLIQKAIQ